ncbi:MAG: methyl-accepting chemotaxis protein [Spirochaetales bacterium]|nr:methyl-accepting chemotaxis protein [Spirochaetales bacterium]
MKNKSSFRTRMVIFTGLVFIFSIGFVIFLSNYVARKSLATRLLTREIPSHIENILGEVDKQFVEISTALSTLAEDPFLQEWLVEGEDPAQLAMIEERLRLNVEHFHTMGSNLSSARTGNYYQYGSGGFKVAQLAETDRWFTAFGASGKAVKINPYTNHAALGEVAFMNVRIDRDGEFLGILSISLRLSDFVNKVVSETLGDEGQNMMVSRDGLIQLHQDKSLIGQVNLKEDPRYADHIDSLLGGEEYQFKYRRENRKVFIVNSRYIPELDWYLLTETSESELFHAMNQSLVISLIFSALFLVSGLILLFLLTGIIIKELNVVVHAVDELSRGKGDLTQQISVRARDEAGSLARSLNEFIGHMREMVIDLKETSRSSHDLGMNLASHTEEISATVTEISATMNSINNKTGDLTTEIQGSDQSLSKIQLLLEELEGLIDRETDSIATSSTAVEEMVATIRSLSQISGEKKTSLDDLIQIARQGDRDMDSTVEAIKGISQSVDAMQDMISVINDVSDQINLLSMNAAIEAAHAGDAGKGFAVVAEEIRKLADTTSENTKVISKSLSDVIDTIQNAHKLSGNTGLSIKRIMKEIVEVSGSIGEIISSISEMSGGTDQITGSLSDLVSLSSDVKSSSREMVLSTKRIKSSFEQVIDLALQGKSGMGEINTGMEEISTALVNLSDLGSLNARNISRVNDIVGGFKTEEDEGDIG